MNLIKLLPIALSASAIVTGSASVIANQNHQTNSQKQPTSFLSWAEHAEIATNQQNLKAMIGTNKIADWKMSDGFSIDNKSIDVKKQLINVTVNDHVWNLTAVITNKYSGNSYDVNQWFCSVQPIRTNANQWWWVNWYAGYQDFRHEYIKTQLVIMDTYWERTGLTSGEESRIVDNHIMKDGGELIWNVNIQNETLNNNTVKFTIHFFPILQKFYDTIDATVTYNGAHQSFNSNEIKPVQTGWTRVYY